MKLTPHIPDHAIIVYPWCFRFYVTKYSADYLTAFFSKPWLVNTESWYVVDMATPALLKARGTHGYKTKGQAIKVAREYRDSYGAWWPFLY
jgi:hypothetical protein